jgi:hypothetical protein
MLESMIEKIVEESDPELVHKVAKWAIAGFSAILVEHFLRKAYDISLAAYRAKQM